MKKEIYLAAATGDVEFLKAARANDVEAGVAVYSDHDLMGVTSSVGDNIIHVAAEHGQLEFVKAALQGFDATQRRKLICATNCVGDTPLHLAAKLASYVLAEHLVDVAQAAQCSYPWRIQNNKGNAPLHVALINGGKSIRVAAYLVGVGPEVASYPNHREQTPLHLAVSYNNQDAKTSMTNMINKLNSLGGSLDYTKSLFEEDSLSLINLLLEADATVCCLKDNHGMTPILRAAQKSYVSAVEAIISYCPDSVKICDSSGKSVLHHIKFPTSVEARKFLKIPGISVLMDHQDEDGNTPLHTAIMKCDYNIIKAMIDSNANFAIQNNEGISSATLIQSNSSCFLDDTEEDIRRSKMMKEEIMMPKELFEAAYNGNWQYLSERFRESQSDDHQLQSRLPDGSNILHVVFQHGIHLNRTILTSKEEFMKEAPKKFPILLCQTDFQGCTPLHYLLPLWNFDQHMFIKLMDALREIKDQLGCYPLPPWEARDSHGDTLLHVALRYGKYAKYEMAEFVIQIMDAKLFGETNNSNETPLHVLCRYGWHFIGESRKLFELLIEKDGSVIHSYDVDGFTPLVGIFFTLDIAERILELCPESIKQLHQSQFGRNILHFIDLDPDNRYHQKFIGNPNMKSLMYQVDREGNTPLHLAIIQRRFGTAQLLFQFHDYHYQEIEYEAFMIHTHLTKNNDNKTTFDLLRATHDIPRKFQNFLLWVFCDDKRQDKLKIFKESLYGVHYSDMKDFMGTLGVVAALLATITFTAAFTVPGGYDQDKGFPILAKEVAFQVFMVTDVIGMCSSVIALCCLIWFFTSNRIEDEGTRLGDLSMGFLQLSFYATLVAFMTGVYVTTSSQVHWLAVFTCVLCSLVLLLMRKHFMMIYLGDVFYLVYDVAKAIKNLLKFA